MAESGGSSEGHTGLGMQTVNTVLVRVSDRNKGCWE
jgi:hypothetical protein